MAFTYTYTVTSLKVKDEVNADGETLQNSVCQTYWKVVGVDENDNQGEFSGATPFTAGSVSLANFVNFADLTEEQVIGWITAVVEGDAAYKAHIDGVIQGQIDAATETEETMPWAPAPEVVDDPEGEEAPAG
jgi:hypothetical protein